MTSHHFTQSLLCNPLYPPLLDSSFWCFSSCVSFSPPLASTCSPFLPKKVLVSPVLPRRPLFPPRSPTNSQSARGPRGMSIHRPSRKDGDTPMCPSSLLLGGETSSHSAPQAYCLRPAKSKNDRSSDMSVPFTEHLFILSLGLVSSASLEDPWRQRRESSWPQQFPKMEIMGNR